MLRLKNVAIEKQDDDVDIFSANKDLVNILELIGSYYTLSRDTYRAKAFNNASAKIATLHHSFLSGAELRNEITGIGVSIESAIDEFLATGTILRLKDLESQYPDRKQIIDLFTSFYGIGPITAIKLYDRGFRTVEDLWFKGNLTSAQKIGIQWRDHINVPIEREEMDVIYGKIRDIFNVYGIKWEITGSYRRGELYSNDIDLLVESQEDLNMSGVIVLLGELLVESLAQGETKFMGIFKLGDKNNGHRIDIRLLSPESYIPGLMYFTGSQAFNILMRQRANHLNMTLNEYGLYGTNGLSTPNIITEQSIFKVLGVKYLQPVERIRNIDSLELI